MCNRYLASVGTYDRGGCCKAALVPRHLGPKVLCPVSGMSQARAAVDRVRLISGVRGRVELRTGFILRFACGSSASWIDVPVRADCVRLPRSTAGRVRYRGERHRTESEVPWLPSSES
jgi:hypothetical protein